MGKVKALLCCISKYNFMPSLEFCKNDSFSLAYALENGIKVDRENIKIIANEGEITNGCYMKELKTFCSNTENDDTLIIYFSGHGIYEDEEHYLCATNSVNRYTYINTNYMTEIISSSHAKSKLIILDCCQADGSDFNKENHFDIESTIEKFYGNGCAVFCSCKKNEESHKYDNEDISAFTKFICDSFLDEYSIRDGNLYLNDFKNLILIYARAWSRKYPTKVQTPIFRSNIFGTLVFPIFKKAENIKKSFPTIYNDEYDIVSVENSVKSHTGKKLLKAYCAKVNMKVEITKTNALTIFNKIIEQVKKIYFRPQNWRQEIVDNDPVSIIWIYIANDLLDIEDGRYLYRVVWAKEEMDYWLNSLGQNAIKGKNISYKMDDSYVFLKSERLNNTLDDGEIINRWDDILNKIIQHTEKLLNIYRMYLSEDIDYKFLQDEASKINILLRPVFYQADDIPFSIPNSKVKKYDDQCINLVSTIRGLVMLYGLDSTRDERNRKECFEIELRNYYSALDLWVKYKMQIENNY